MAFEWYAMTVKCRLMPFKRHSKYFHEILCKSQPSVHKLMHACILFFRHIFCYDFSHTFGTEMTSKWLQNQVPKSCFSCPFFGRRIFDVNIPPKPIKRRKPKGCIDRSSLEQWARLNTFLSCRWHLRVPSASVGVVTDVEEDSAQMTLIIKHYGIRE